jgi:Rieske 2Fe-2S family protein
MNLREHVGKLLASRRDGFALPGAFFSDDALYEAELEIIFARHWIFLASAAEIPEDGDYRTYQIGRYPVFLLRRDDGAIVAFHNTCRHRGSRILQQDAGIAGATLMCPYHRWTYDLDGHVIGCGGTGEEARAQPPLKPVHVRQIEGLVFVCLADEPPNDIEDMAARISPYLAPHALANTRVAKQTELIEHGNWKLTIENNRECFHCAGHPELLKSLFEYLNEPDEKSMSDKERAEYCRFLGARDTSQALWKQFAMPYELIEELHGRATGFRTERLVLDGAGESMTPDTRAASRRLLGAFTDARLGTLHLHVQPNAWFHFLADHVLTFSALPLGRNSTLVRTTWLVHADAREGVDYDVNNLTSVWDATNRQDAEFVAETQRGVLSPAYLPGPIGDSEFMVNRFHSWYEERLRAALDL